MIIKHTEAESNHQELENKEIGELLRLINKEDQSVARAVQKAIPSIEPLVKQITTSIKNGGKLAYIGAGTSGRLGILDASECPPTFGVPSDLVVGIIAGGDSAIRNAVEKAEDDRKQGWKDLKLAGIRKGDVVIGLASSGTTPYVVGALKQAQKSDVITACITCNEQTPVAKYADYPIEVIVGPEFVTGSTRMKSGTAQKMVLNMISTTTMIQLGRVKGNRMVDMQLSNEKLIERGTKMIMEKQAISKNEAREKLLTYGSVREALKH